MKLWIACDKCGYIGLYRSKPTWESVNSYREDWEGDYMGYLPRDSFPSVTFENSPQQVEIKLI